MDDFDHDPPDLALVDALHRLAVTIVRSTPRELSLTAASVLSALEREGPERITALAEAQGVAQPSMTALVTRLEHLGLVSRRAHPADGRVVLVALAPGGADALRTRRRQGRRVVEELLTRLGAEDRRRLDAALPAIQALLVPDGAGRSGSPAAAGREVPA